MVGDSFRTFFAAATVPGMPAVDFIFDKLETFPAIFIGDRAKSDLY
jgi:hypothetical protein